MQDNIQRLAVGLPLHVFHRHVEIEVLVPDMAQLMLQRLLLL